MKLVQIVLVIFCSWVLLGARSCSDEKKPPVIQDNGGTTTTDPGPVVTPPQQKVEEPHDPGLGTQYPGPIVPQTPAAVRHDENVEQSQRTSEVLPDKAPKADPVTGQIPQKRFI